jgi:hypothetical protein
VELTEYRKIRNLLQTNAAPGSPQDVAALEHRLRATLLATGLFADVEVEHTDDVDALVIAMCRFPSQMSHVQIAQRLEQAWLDRLRFDFWEAHTTIADDDQVELQGATRTSSSGTYVTVHVVAQKAHVPAQRVGSSW